MDYLFVLQRIPALSPLLKVALKTAADHITPNNAYKLQTKTMTS